MRISDWSSDVCSSDLLHRLIAAQDEETAPLGRDLLDAGRGGFEAGLARMRIDQRTREQAGAAAARHLVGPVDRREDLAGALAFAQADAEDAVALRRLDAGKVDRKSTRLNSSH